MILSWGKQTILVRPYKAGAYGSSDTWTELSIPVEGSTAMNITEGDTKEAKQEGGVIVDSVKSANTYELVFRLFVKKTDAAAYPAILTPINGVVTGEFAFRVIPEDPDCKAVEIPRASVSCIENLGSEEGITLEYHAKAIVDNSSATGHYNDGKLVHIAVLGTGSGSISVGEGALDFTSSADSTGKAVMVNCPNAFSASSSETFATASAIGNAVVVTVTANTSGDVRTATVTVTDSVTSNTATIAVTQAG